MAWDVRHGLLQPAGVRDAQLDRYHRDVSGGVSGTDSSLSLSGDSSGALVSRVRRQPAARLRARRHRGSRCRRRASRLRGSPAHRWSRCYVDRARIAFWPGERRSARGVGCGISDQRRRQRMGRPRSCSDSARSCRASRFALEPRRCCCPTAALGLALSRPSGTRGAHVRSERSALPCRGKRGRRSTAALSACARPSGRSGTCAARRRRPSSSRRR